MTLLTDYSSTLLEKIRDILLKYATEPDSDYEHGICGRVSSDLEEPEDKAKSVMILQDCWGAVGLNSVYPVPGGSQSFTYFKHRGGLWMGHQAELRRMLCHLTSQMIINVLHERQEDYLQDCIKHNANLYHRSSMKLSLTSEAVAIAMHECFLDSTAEMIRNAELTKTNAMVGGSEYLKPWQELSPEIKALTISTADFSIKAIDKLIKDLPDVPGVDYRKVLSAYIDAVGEAEGTDFLGIEELYEKTRDHMKLNEAEFEALLAIARPNGKELPNG